MFFEANGLYSNVYDAISLFRNEWEQKHRVPGIYYINNDHANVIKFMKVTSNLTQYKNGKRIGRKCRLV